MNFSATLVASLLYTEPIAIGLSPPSLFRSAVSLAPKRAGHTTAGISPRMVWLTSVVRAVTRRTPASPADLLIRSLRCAGRRPSSPALEPVLKLPMAVVMSPSVASAGNSSSWSGPGGKSRSAGASGCFCWIKAMFSSDGRATVSLEVRRPRAPFTSPSESLAPTRFLSSSPSDCCCRLRRPLGPQSCACFCTWVMSPSI